MILSTRSLQASNLDLKPPTQKEIIAQKLKEGQACKLDLIACKDGMEKDQGCESPIYSIAGGFIGGAVFTVVLIAIFGGLK